MVDTFISGLIGVVDDLANARNRLHELYDQAVKLDGGPEKVAGNLESYSSQTLDASIQIQAAYTTIGNLILKIDPTALDNR